MVYSVLLLVPFLFAAVHAANDWSKPCFQGVCSYDLPASAGSASGTMKIWGSQDAISDITPAAGWMILGCAPDVLAQDIRLVCKSNDTSAAGCDHLYQNIGADGKIVRLPENCGKSPFARVAKSWVPADQSIPASIAPRLVRRDGSQPEVKALSLDTNFGAVDTSKAGKVNIAIKGATVPGLNGEIQTPPTSQRHSRFSNRGAFDFVGDAVDSVGNAVDSAGNALVDAVDNVGNAIGSAGKAAGNAISEAAGAVGDANNIDINNSTGLEPIDVDNKFNLLNQAISCPPLKASVNIDIDAKAHAEVALGVAASGTIVPPNIDNFAITTDFSANIDGSVDFTADVSGTLDSGKIKVFEIGIPGLDFPGILTIGPTFQINAQAKATLDLNVDLNVGLNYNVAKGRLVFPPRDKNNSGSFQVGDTPLKLSASPSVTATGTVEAHLIPSINLGISALDNVAVASVFLELDASAVLQLTLQAKAGENVTIDKNQTASASSNAPVTEATSSGPANATHVAASHAIRRNSHAMFAARTATTNTSASFGGCVDVSAGLDVNAGADASFFGLFDAQTKVNLFTKKFDLFKKCFGSGVGGKRSNPRRASLGRRAGLLGLTCPNAGVGGVASVADLSLNGVDINTTGKR